MDRKIQSCFLSWIMLFNVFTCVLQMNAMKQHTFEEIIPEGFSPGVPKELEVEESEALKKALKKEVVEAKNVAIQIIIAKNIEEGKKNLSPNGEIYLYDQTTGKGSIFEEKLIPMSIFLTGILEDLENISRPMPISHSSGDIQILHKILERCEEFRATDEYAKKAEAIIKKELQTKNFVELIKILLLANYMLIDKQIFYPIVNQVKQKVNIIIDGHGLFTDNDKAILDSIDHNLLKIIVGDQWNIFLETMKIDLAKKHFGNAKKYSYSIKYDPAMMGISFSPDKRFLGMQVGWRNLYPFVIDIANNESINLWDMPAYSGLKYPINKGNGWIEKNKILYAYLKKDETLHLILYDCNTKNISMEKLSLPDYEIFSEIHIYDYLVVEDEIIFFYWIGPDTINYKSCGIGIFNYKDKSIDYIKLEDVPGRSIGRIIAKTEQSILFLYSAYKETVLCTLELQAKKMVQLKKISSKLELEFTRDGKNMASVYRQTIDLYSPDFTDISWHKNDELYQSVVFSTNGLMLAATVENKIVFLSTATGKKIGELQAKDGQCFQFNAPVAFSMDDSTLCIGNSSSESRALEFLIMKLVPDIYLPVFAKLKQSSFSFSQILWLISLQQRSNNGENPGQLTNEGKTTFDTFSHGFRQLLVDVGYVAHEQKFVEQVPFVIPEAQQPVLPKKNWLQQLRDYLNKIILGLPQSG